MGCGGSSTTSQTQIPEWVTQAGQDTYAKANNFFQSGWSPPPTDRVAGFSPMQTDVFAKLAGYTPTDFTGQAKGLIEAGTAPINAPSVTDESGQNGALGPIGDYMNPYLASVLTPLIDAITKNSAAQGKQLDSQAIGAHAFGDARHGIAQGEQNLNTNKAIGDAAAGVYSGGYTQAMAQRQSDLDRKMAAAAGNRAADFTGATGLLTTGTTSQNNFMSWMQSLLGAGNLQQQQAQNVKNVPFQNWQLQMQDAYDRMASLVSTLGQLPYNKGTTTTTDPGIGGMLGGIGSIIGAIPFGML